MKNGPRSAGGGEGGARSEQTSAIAVGWALERVEIFRKISTEINAIVRGRDVKRE